LSTQKMTDPIDRPCPSRVKRPTAKLADVNNLQQPALSFQHVAVEAERLWLQQDTEIALPPNSSLPPSSPSATSTCPTSPVATGHSSEPSINTVPLRSKRLIVLSDDENDKEIRSHKRSKRTIVLSDDDDDEKTETQTKGKTKADSK